MKAILQQTSAFALLLLVLPACGEVQDTGVPAPVPVDADGDGYPLPEDCDDGDPAIHPGATERCDLRDEDCDGEVDGARAVDARAWFRDLDGDGRGHPDTRRTACTAPWGYVDATADCDDANPFVSPDALEVCNGLDDDCDGHIDEDDALDTRTWYPDVDGDGYGVPVGALRSCIAPSGYVFAAGDCDDGRSLIHPGAAEICNHLDDDCDTSVDEPDAMDASTWYPDQDGDGFGAFDGTVEACAPPAGFVGTPGDCDDALFGVSPTADEVCNGRDDDCDHLVDEPDALDALPWYVDDDRDGYGVTDAAVRACTPPPGTTALPGDCDDGSAGVFPGAEESCDGVDDDCDGVVDDHPVDPSAFFQDVDGDGHGRRASFQWACTAPAGWVPFDDDCEDADPWIHPGATEICNGRDDDCDHRVDAHAADASTWYQDLDRDEHGSTTVVSVSCDAPTDSSLLSGDCDDADASVYPGALERCDGQDNDCDGTLSPDEADADGDGFDVCGDRDCDDGDPALAWDGDGDGDGEPDCFDVDLDGNGVPDTEERTVLAAYFDEHWGVSLETMLWGDPHSHSLLSSDARACDALDPEGAYDWAREEEGLDFVALTDHAEGINFATIPEGSTAWEYAVEAARAANDEDAFGGVFFVFPAWEFTHSNDSCGEGSGYGHKQVMFRDFDDLPGTRLCAECPAWCPEAVSSATDLWEWLAAWGPQARGEQGRVQTVPHHPSAFEEGDTGDLLDYRTDWSVMDEDFVRLVEIVSKWGSFEGPVPVTAECAEEDDPVGYIWSMNDQSSTVRAVLGHHWLLSGSMEHVLGFVGGTDNHSGRPGNDIPDDCEFPKTGGITGVAVTEPTREALWDALWKRRTVGATSGHFGGALLAVETSDGHVFMGEQASFVGDVHVRALVHEQAQMLDLIVDGCLVYSTTDTWIDHALSLGEGRHYLYVRTLLNDGQVRQTWSSPVYLGDPD